MNNSLPIALDLAVALNIGVLKKQGGPSDQDYKDAQLLSADLGERGDILLAAGARKANARTCSIGPPRLLRFWPFVRAE